MKIEKDLGNNPTDLNYIKIEVNNFIVILYDDRVILECAWEYGLNKGKHTASISSKDLKSLMKQLKIYRKLNKLNN